MQSIVVEIAQRQGVVVDVWSEEAKSRLVSVIDCTYLKKPYSHDLSDRPQLKDAFYSLQRNV
jgi:hypothetical protein